MINCTDQLLSKKVCLFKKWFSIVKKNNFSSWLETLLSWKVKENLKNIFFNEFDDLHQQGTCLFCVLKKFQPIIYLSSLSSSSSKGMIAKGNLGGVENNWCFHLFATLEFQNSFVFTTTDLPLVLLLMINFLKCCWGTSTPSFHFKMDLWNWSFWWRMSSLSSAEKLCFLGLFSFISKEREISVNEISQRNVALRNNQNCRFQEMVALWQ